MQERRLHVSDSWLTAHRTIQSDPADSFHARRLLTLANAASLVTGRTVVGLQDDAKISRPPHASVARRFRQTHSWAPPLGRGYREKIGWRKGRRPEQRTQTMDPTGLGCKDHKHQSCSDSKRTPPAEDKGLAYGRVTLLGPIMINLTR